MAEIVGLVASGITLADTVGKIGKGIYNLKKLWDEVQDVPEAISDLFKFLDLMLPMVEGIARDIEAKTMVLQDMEAVERCILYCRKAIADETAMMNNLIFNIDATKKLRRNRDKLKVVLQKDVLARHEKKLEGIIKALQVAQAEYSRAFTKAIPTSVAMIVTDHLSSAATPTQWQGSGVTKDRSKYEHEESNSKSVVSFSSVVTSSSMRLPWKRPSFFGNITSATKTRLMKCGSTEYDNTERGWRLQFPYWATQKAWEVRMFSGWQYHFRTYNVVPSTAPIVEYVMEGKVEAMLALFRQGEASPFDVILGWSTLLQCALMFQQVSVMRLLLQLGCHISKEDAFGIIIGHDPTFSNTLEADEPFICADNSWDLDILLPSNGSLDILRLSFCSDQTIARTLLPILIPNHYELPIVERLRIFSLFGHTKTAAVFTTWLWRNGIMVSEDIQELRSHGYSVLQIIMHQSSREMVLEAIDTYKTKITHREINRPVPPERRNSNIASWRRWLNSKQRSQLHKAWLTLRNDALMETIQFQRQNNKLSARDLSLSALISGYEMGFPRKYPVLYGAMRRREKEHLFENTLWLWLNDLHRNGVDLELYGRVELEVLRSTRQHPDTYAQYAFFQPHTRSCKFRTMEEKRKDHRLGCTRRCREILPILESFIFGPLPSDWAFSWDWELDFAVSEFWAMIETPSLSVPGSWVDSDDDLSDSETFYETGGLYEPEGTVDDSDDSED